MFLCSANPRYLITLCSHSNNVYNRGHLSLCVCVHNVHPARLIATSAFHSSCATLGCFTRLDSARVCIPLLRRLNQRLLAGIAQPSVAYRCPTMMGLSIDVANLCTRCTRTAAAFEASPRFSAIGDASVSPCYRSKYARNSRALCCVVSRTHYAKGSSSSACSQACLCSGSPRSRKLFITVYTMRECISSGTGEDIIAVLS